MTYEIITATGRFDLAKRVTDAMRRGAQPVGAPFYDQRSTDWCQAVEMPEPSEEIKLKEPKKR